MIHLAQIHMSSLYQCVTIPGDREHPGTLPPASSTITGDHQHHPPLRLGRGSWPHICQWLLAPHPPARRGRDQETLGIYTGHFYACVADITRQLNTAAFAQQETFANLQAVRSGRDRCERREEAVGGTSSGV